MNGKLYKIQHFYDLNVWKEAHSLVLLTYKTIENFPKKETFVIVSQMLRAAISITSNIAEGFGRQGLKDKILKKSAKNLDRLKHIIYTDMFDIWGGQTTPFLFKK